MSAVIFDDIINGHAPKKKNMPCLTRAILNMGIFVFPAPTQCEYSRLDVK